MIQTQTPTLSPLARRFIASLSPDAALALARERMAQLRAGQAGNYEIYSDYQNAPAEFGHRVLSEQYTADVERVMQSVCDHPVTIARSANGVGKTHAAARIAVWFYKTHPDAQVYTTSAPPERNLKLLLWGEIDNLIDQHPGLFAGDDIRTLHIARSPREFITGVTIPTSGTSAQREAKFAGKHAPAILFIVDEGDAVPNEIYRAIESSMSGGLARFVDPVQP